jgi:hypothetical protein
MTLKLDKTLENTRLFEQIRDFSEKPVTGVLTLYIHQQEYENENARNRRPKIFAYCFKKLQLLTTRKKPASSTSSKIS